MVRGFLEQDTHLEAFITGPAGSGKTTKLKDVVLELEELNINYCVVAYTHKAKEVLISKLPVGTPIKTLWSFLKKRPTLNNKATKLHNIVCSTQTGKPKYLQLLIIDEFSFIGEDDYFSLGELQDELELEGQKPLKIIYVGDLNQLSPIKSESAVVPKEPYWTKLTTIHRNRGDISKPLSNLVDMIEGRRDMHYLEPTENFVRGVDIDKLYKEDTNPSKIMLAFTNRAVQKHNELVQGYKEPKVGDMMYCPTLRTGFKLLEEPTDKYTDVCITPNNEITCETKYNPIKYLNTLEYVKFYCTGGGVIPAIFGSYENKRIREEIGKRLVRLNNQNQDSKKAFRECKIVNDFVSILDFTHCMTIHKSQGSEFDHVYIDTKDLSTCLNTQERMKLLYVAMSRARYKIFCSN